MNIRKVILVLSMISILGSIVVACSNTNTTTNYKTVSYKELNLFTLDTDNFINDVANQLNSKPEKLIILKDSFSTKIVFDSNGDIKVLHLKFIDASKETKSVYTLKLDYLFDNKGTNKNLYIHQDQADLDSAVTNVKLSTFIKSIHRADWKEIINNMEKSELYGFNISMNELVTTTSYENTNFIKYYVSKTDKTSKLKKNEILDINGMTFSTFIENVKLLSDGYEGLGSEMSVLFEIAD